jgi:hypothetical protein
LPEFNFSGENVYAAFFIDVNPGADIVRQVFVESAAAGFSLAGLLSKSSSHRHDEENAEPENLDEITTIEREVVVWCGE